MRIKFNSNDRKIIGQAVSDALDQVEQRTLYPGDSVSLDLDLPVGLRFSLGEFDKEEFGKFVKEESDG